MKGKVVMRFVGNRQEPEPDPEPLNFEGVSLWPHGTLLHPPEIPKATLDYLERWMKRAEEIALAIAFDFAKRDRVGKP